MEQATEVKIFGMKYYREAEVVTINGFSGHADEPGLLNWARTLQQRPHHTFIVHGEPAAGQELAQRLRHDLGFRNVMQPELDQTVEIT